jgi:hypothetical protein
MLMDPFLSQMNVLYTPTVYFTSILVLSFHLQRGVVVFPFNFNDKTFVHFIFPRINSLYYTLQYRLVQERVTCVFHCVIRTGNFY